MKRLNTRQIEFCKEYAVNGGNATRAYQKAYKASLESAKVLGAKLANKDYIQAYVCELKKDRERKSEWTRLRAEKELLNIVENLSPLIVNEKGIVSNQTAKTVIDAIKTLNDMCGYNSKNVTLNSESEIFTVNIKTV